MKRSCRAVGVASCCFVLLAMQRPASAQLAPVETIVLGGSEEPVDPSNLFDVFTFATMDARGIVAFQAASSVRW